MLTFFTTAKAFAGHGGVIQRNALSSWLRLHPEVEIIVFGDDEGAAEVCRKLGIHHHPRQERHSSGMKYLNYMFDRAQDMARHDFLCYSNCDIIFMDDFYQAFVKARAWRKQFLIIGQRWDTDVTEPIEFSNPGWAASLRSRVEETGFRQKRHFVDYFLFSKGLYDHVPPLVIGRSWWDHWLVWKALSKRVPVIDCSAAVVAVHQNHGYGYHPQGKLGTNEDPLAQRNRALAGNGTHLRFTVDATHVFTRKGTIRRALFHKLFVFTLPFIRDQVIFKTYPIRKPLGLRRESLTKLARMFHLKA